ncbi:MAG: hypothetical protein HYZ86_02200 [Candidatus Omnitrophica bacterium]|nr:hypothetical protein [Candidatus Omnitrophota bacterium]
MKHREIKIFSVAILSLTLAGCAFVAEVGRTFWGSSIREMEKRRVDAITRTYPKGYWECMEAVLKVIEENHYLIFQKDEVRGHVVVMGIPGYINTTEVGIFFVEISDTEVRVEISSLSTNAKRAVAKALFKGLDKVLTAP